MTARAANRRGRRTDFWLERCGQPYVRRDSEDRTGEPSRSDTNQSVRVAVQMDRPADHRLVGMEYPLPERMRNDRPANGRPWPIVVQGQPATEWDDDPEHLEIVSADELPGESFRLTVRIHRDGHCLLPGYLRHPRLPWRKGLSISSRFGTAKDG
jgi:hypothetical protein